MIAELPKTYHIMKPCRLKLLNLLEATKTTTNEEATNHFKRFNTEYFPITIDDHFNLYKEIGFASIEILWKSYMQVVFVMLK